MTSTAQIVQIYPNQEQVAEITFEAVSDVVEDVLDATGMASHTSDQLIGALEGTAIAFLSRMLRFMKTNDLDQAEETLEEYRKAMVHALPMMIEEEKQFRMENGDDA